MKNTFLCVLIVLLGYSQVSAQVSSLVNPTYGYTFLNTTSTYTSLGAGGTVFQSGTTLNTDAVSSAISLPFTFTYNGIKENTIYISNNGFITFASAPAAGGYSPLSTTTTSGYDGAIAGTGMNCVASTVAGTSPEIRYGSNGSGDFVVQFQDIGQSGFTAIRMTYQIILKADGKTVQIVYGPNNVGVASAGQCQVGLRGTNDEDWNNRTLASGGNWNTAGGAAGTVNTSAMTLTATSTLPASGRTFQWSPTSYTPTYLTNPGGVYQEFTTWVNGAGPANLPSTNWASNGYGNASWQIDNNPGTTTTTGWTSQSSYAYTPVDYASAVGGHSARFHAGNSNSPQVGILDYYVDMSSITGTPTLDFYHINTSGTDILQVFLSTNGGSTFSQIGSNIGVSAAWTAKSISLGSTNSATTIIRFKATADFGFTDIGIDHLVITPPPALPTISGFTPSPNLCANGGQTVTITGTNFTGTTSVKFNSVNAVSFSVVSSTSITAVTPSGLTAGTIDVTNPAGTANSSSYTVVSNPTVAVSPTSNSLCVPGATAVALTASGASTYTWGPASGLSATTGTSVNALPTSSTTYTVIGTDANGCTATSTSVFTVTAGVLATASASPLNVCNGANSQLDVEAVQGGGLSVIGAGASNSSSTAASFFPGFWGGAKTQYIVLGSELIAQGLKAGNITALAYEPTTAGQTYQGFFISLGTTAQSSMTTSFITTGLTEVYAGTLANNGILPVANTVNTLTFGTGGTASSFYWDGSSNIVVSISWSSVPNASTATSSTMKVDAPGFTCSAYDQQDNVSPATMKASTAADGTGTNRPRFTFTGNKLVVSPTYAWTESPATTLSSTSIANPMSNGITATNNYTVTVTGAGGCTATSTLTVNVAGSVVCSAITSSNGATLCAGQNTTLTASATIGGTPYTYDWTADPTLSATNIANPVATPTATTTYTCTVTDACGTTCSTTITINVNALPTVVVSPTSGTICNPGGTSVSLTASGTATGYTWSPATGLSATSGASVNATPSSSTTYTVTGTDANGCTNTATAVVNVALYPQNVTSTATPATICSGSSSNLTSSVNPTTVNDYSYVYSTGSSLDPMTGATNVLSSSNDDTPMASPAGIGFTFIYNGVSYNQFSASPDGWLMLGSVTASSQFSNAVTSTTNIPKIYPYWDDLATGTTGNVSTLVTGTAPNRIFKIQWFVTIPRNTTGAANSTFQVWLYETTNAIEFRYGTLGTGTMSASVGLTGSATQYNSVTVSSNTASNSSANDANTGQPASGTLYSFTPASITYAWTPSGDVVSPSSQNTATNALLSTTTYTVTATNNGCSTTSTTTVTISSGASITTDPTNTSACTNSNASFTVVATGPGLTYQWFVDDGTGFAPISPGAPYSGETSATLTISNPSASLDNYQYQVEVSSACGSAVTSQPATLTVNTPSTVSTNPSSGLICNPGGSAVSITASGASTYTWAPTSGLTPSTGATVSANPSSTTTYTVTGVDGNGCSASATVAITLAQSITSLNTTGSSTSVCEGAAITLASAGVLAGYQMNASGSEPFYDINSSGTSVGANTDDSEHNISMPAFTFNGVSYTTARVGNNGVIVLGSTTGDISSSNAALPSTANSAGNIFLAPYWDDLDVNLAGTIKTETVGSKFIIQYTGLDQFNYNTGAITFQVQLDNSTGEIHFIYDDVTFGDVLYDAGASATVGIQYSASSALQYSLNSASLTTGQCITFTPNTLAYNWTGPNSYSAATQNASVNPSVSASAGTYTVTATSGAGCTLTSTIAVSLNPTSAPTSVGTYTNTSIHTDGATRNYIDGSCNLIASIQDAVGGNVLGNTTVTQVLSTTVPSPNVDGYIYGRRKYTVNAASTGAATVKLYFTQADFDDYNASNSNFLDLPTSGNNSDPNKPYFRIARVNGAAYTISGSLGDSLVWNSTDSRWEVNFPVTDVNADYYFVSMASCSGINVANLQATNIQGTSVTATWDNLVTTPAWGWYSLQYRTTQPTPGSWVNAGTSNGGTTSRLIIGLAPGTEYELQIRRHCSSQSEGPWSTGVIFSTTSPTCALAPTLTASTINSNNATITWPSVAGAGWLEIRYKESSSGTWISAGTLGGTATSKLFTGLSASTSYDVEVRSYCASNSQPGAWGSVTFATTALSGCALPPTLAATTVNATNITISWTSTGAAWYEFRYKETSSGTWISAGTLGGAATSRQFTGLSASTSYDFQARSFCANGQPSAWDGITQATAALSGCALPPVLTTATVTATNVTTTWSSVSGAAWYEFRYKATSSGTWISAGTLGGAATSKMFTGLTASTSYDFQARSFCSNGQPSAWGGITQATNGLSGCELPPAFTTPSTTSTTMNVTWPSVAGAGWYEFRYRIVGAPSWTTGGTLGGAATSKGLIGLQASTNYEFEGRTFCANGQPSAWGSVSFTTGAPMMPILFAEETAKAGFMVYPNPTRDQITIEFSTETLQATKVKVLDMTGRVVKTVEAVPQAGEHQYTLSLSELSAGMYTVQVYTDDKLSYVTKVQKQD